MGEYEPVKERRQSEPLLPRRGGGLFPLSEEGSYGPPPSFQSRIMREDQGNLRKNKGIKTYASYSVSRFGTNTLKNGPNVFL